MAEGLCLTGDSNIFDQIVPDQDDLFLGPVAAEGPEGPAPKRSQPWFTKHVSISDHADLHNVLNRFTMCLGMDDSLSTEMSIPKLPLEIAINVTLHSDYLANFMNFMIFLTIPNPGW